MARVIIFIITAFLAVNVAVVTLEEPDVLQGKDHDKAEETADTGEEIEEPHNAALHGPWRHHTCKL